MRDHVDLEAEEAWIEYAVDGRVRRWSAEVHDDWADMMVVSYLMDDLERDGRRFWTREGGQIVNLYFLDEAAARGVNGLFADRDPLVPVLGGGG